MSEYEYKQINLSVEREDGPPFPGIDDVANKYAADGWRTVAFIPSKGRGYSECLLLERKIPKENPYHQWANRDSWISWELEHNPTENPYDPGREWSMWHRWEEGKVRRGH